MSISAIPDNGGLNSLISCERRLNTPEQALKEVDVDLNRIHDQLKALERWIPQSVPLKDRLATLSPTERFDWDRLWDEILILSNERAGILECLKRGDSDILLGDYYLEQRSESNRRFWSSHKVEYKPSGTN